MNARPDLLGRRGLFLMSLLALAGLTVLGRLAWLQLVRGPELREIARRQHARVEVLDPGRGPILDRNGRVLALSVDVPSVYADPSEVAEPESTARALSGILGIPSRELREKLQRPGYFVWLRRKVDPRVKAELDALALPGIGTVPEAKRVYPHGPLFAHLLGAAGLDNQGLAGLEYLYDADVRGEPGRLRTLRDARGEPFLPEGLQRSEPTGGRTLVLTVDEAVQHVTVQALQRAVTACRAAGGAALVMNPETGQVLSISSLPSFDPNTFPSSPPSTRRNRALELAPEPGSTLKIVTAAAALRWDLFRVSDRIDCGNGAVQIKSTVIHDVRPWGDLSFGEVIARSSNVGAIRIGQRVGARRLYETLRLFGFGRPTGIDLPGESPGLLRPPPEWSGLSLASISMGQEIGVTPVQMLAAVSAIANGGTLLRPHVVSEVRDPDGRTVRARGRTEVRRVLSPAHAEALRRILVRAVEEGTGRKARVHGYEVAGKTGTAQKAGPSGTYEEGRFVSSFAGFAPAGRPVLAAIVVIDEPRDGPIYGGDVAAPVFAEIAAETLRILRVPPEGDAAGVRTVRLPGPDTQEDPESRPGAPGIARLGI